MANYNINPQSAESVVDEMVSSTKLLQQSLETLQASVNRFTAANNGNAPEAYAGAQAMWNQGQQEMQQSLNVGLLRLQQIIDGYVRGDRQGASLFL